MTKVKICGITNLKDALSAVESGADLLGFNFYEKSPRYIDPRIARQIVGEIPPGVFLVGVFVNAKVKQVAEIVELAKLHVVQLHGDEDNAFVREMRTQTDATLIRALRVNGGFRADSANEYGVDAILLDSYSADRYGGTGELFDWETAKEVKGLVQQLYLAGGLTPDNVAYAVRSVRPYAVDVASGVESIPGKKDPLKMEAFIRNAKNA